MAIGAAIGVITNGLGNLQNGESFFKGAGRAALMGAMSGLVSAGIGNVAGTFFKDVGARLLFQSVAHGAFGGVMSMADGGSFKSGFSSGAVSSMISAGMGSLLPKGSKGTAALMILSGGLSGGVTAEIAGGNFWAGFKQGVMTSSLNHVVHMAASEIQATMAKLEPQPDPLRLEFDGKELRIMRGKHLLKAFPAVSGRVLEDGTFDYSQERQKLGFTGPIPEGNYGVHIEDTQNWEEIGSLQQGKASIGRGTWPGGTKSWGEHRVQIIPLEGTNTYGRDNMFIHGGSIPGSAGCIDLTTSNNDFFSFMKNSFNKINFFNLNVKY